MTDVKFTRIDDALFEKLPEPLRQFVRQQRDKQEAAQAKAKVLIQRLTAAGYGAEQRCQIAHAVKTLRYVTSEGMEALLHLADAHEVREAAAAVVHTCRVLRDAATFVDEVRERAGVNFEVEFDHAVIARNLAMAEDVYARVEAKHALLEATRANL